MSLLAAAFPVLLFGCTAPTKAPDDTGGEDDSAAASLVHEPEICGRPEVTLVPNGAGFIATTAHYTLHIDGFDQIESENLAALAETAWEGFGAFFGADVAGPLEAYVAADQAGFVAQLAADGISGLDGAGGYYDPGTGRAYLFRQATAYYSRVLLLHELVHQYQGHAGATAGLPPWYVEGLAEALGRHHWDGTCLELRVRPLLSWEDAAAGALAELQAGVDVRAVLAGGDASRPIAQELVRLLASDPAFADGFADWRDAVAAGTSATDLDLFAATVAPVDEVAAAFEAWVPVDQEAMKPIWLDWIPEGDASARGYSDASSAVRVKEGIDIFAMTTDAPTGAANVGTVYGYDPATGDTELAFVSADGSVSRFAVLAGVVTWDVLGTVSVSGGVAWSQSAGEGATTVTIGDTSVELPRTLAAAGGLALYSADAVFEAISWR
ncbi:MAG: hypothetical protein Q8P18_10860 [Pseudomonadota bacterium]|nr:hypothetical protein [Pseudomonadota bacterium]